MPEAIDDFEIASRGLGGRGAGARKVKHSGDLCSTNYHARTAANNTGLLQPFDVRPLVRILYNITFMTERRTVSFFLDEAPYRRLIRYPRVMKRPARPPGGGGAQN